MRDKRGKTMSNVLDVIKSICNGKPLQLNNGDVVKAKNGKVFHEQGNFSVSEISLKDFIEIWEDNNNEK